MSLRDLGAIQLLVTTAQAELPRRTRACEKLISFIYQDVQRLAFAIVGDIDDADQIAQDSLLRVYNNLRTLKSPEAFPKWTATIVSNTAMTFLARESRERDKARRWAGEATEDYAVADDVTSFQAMIEDLDVTERTVVAMRLVEELEFSEIAEILDSGLSSVKMRYYRALDKLRSSAGENR